MFRRVRLAATCGVSIAAMVIGCSWKNEGDATAQWLREREQLPDPADAEPVKEPPINFSTYYAAGHLFEKQRNYKRAIDQYARAIEDRSDFVVAYNRMGVCYTKLRQFQQADQCFATAIRINAKLPYLYNNFGFSLMLQQEWEAAAGHLRTALQLNPEFTRARVNLGIALANHGDFERAFLEFETALGAAQANYNIGILHQSKGRLRQAAASFQRCLELQPQFAKARYQLKRIAPYLNSALEDIEEPEPVAFAAADPEQEQPTSNGLEAAPKQEPQVPSETLVSSKEKEHLVKAWRQALQGLSSALRETSAAQAQTDPALSRAPNPLHPEQESCEAQELDQIVAELNDELQPCTEDEVLDQFVFGSAEESDSGFVSVMPPCECLTGQFIRQAEWVEGVLGVMREAMMQSTSFELPAFKPDVMLSVLKQALIEQWAQCARQPSDRQQARHAPPSAVTRPNSATMIKMDKLIPDRTLQVEEPEFQSMEVLSSATSP